MTIAWLKHPVVILAFTLLAGLFSLSLYSSWRRNQASSAEVANLEGQVSDLNQNLSQLQSQVETASSAASQEKIIRDQLLMQKEGETVMQIPDVGADGALGSPPSPSPEPLQEWQTVLFR